MKKINIFKNKDKNLQSFKDVRGIISDIFFKEKIEHAALIESQPNTIRGNHFHKKTTQYMLIIDGSLEYWYKINKPGQKARKIKLKYGDFITTPPNEIHALKIGRNKNKFIVFSKGIRGGLDYERDTYRVNSIIPSSNNLKKRKKLK